MAGTPLPIDRIENATSAIGGLMTLLAAQANPNEGLYCLLDLIHCELQVALVEMEVEQAERSAASA